MSENKRDFTKKCTRESGIHEYVAFDGLEVCKHCKHEIIKITRVSVISPYTRYIAPIPQNSGGGGIGQSVIVQQGEENLKSEIPDKIFTDIFEATGGKSAIILTFSDILLDENATVKDFKIAVANMTMENIVSTLALVIKALLGQLGGTLNVRKRKE